MFCFCMFFVETNVKRHQIASDYKNLARSVIKDFAQTVFYASKNCTKTYILHIGTHLGKISILAKIGMLPLNRKMKRNR